MDIDVSDAEKQACFICGESVPNDNYSRHVQECAANLSPALSRITTNQQCELFQTKEKSCLNCSTRVQTDDFSGFIIDCPSKHIHCILCLYRLMQQNIETSSTPVCHPRHCSYPLTRHELETFPLDRKSFKKLIPLVKNEKRPLCPKCRYYVHVDEMTSFDDHVANCDLADAIPCEFCACPQTLLGYEDHRQICRSDRPSQRENFINFIMPRTKYPFSLQQITLFIDKQRNQYRITDPHLVINTLAEYGEMFPYQIPKHACDICAEDYVLDDIFVFGCDESHKLCYTCYEEHCRMNMRNGAILICSGCSYVLQYGELKQLRVPDQEKQQFIDYQVQKTFETFTNTCKAFIKCPNQQCRWAFEPRNPNERFCVRCLACAQQFCSLCNQQYHYRSKCHQVAEITQRWFFWCDTERARYLRQRAGEDQVFAKQLAEYEQHAAANKQRNDELRQRYNNTMADEDYKAQNCRLCPHCKRVIQHMGGCASMICGQDYHGGNQQSGCGKSFTWEQAKAYRPAQVKQPRELLNDLPKPKSPVVVHTDIHCDACKEEVRGIRFECVHCPSLIFCEKCEQHATLNHSQQNRSEGCQQHVFRLIMKPGDERGE